MNKVITVRAACEDEAGRGDGAYNLMGHFSPEEFCAELLRTLQADWGLSNPQGVCSLRIEIRAGRHED